MMTNRRTSDEGHGAEERVHGIQSPPDQVLEDWRGDTDPVILASAHGQCILYVSYEKPVLVVSSQIRADRAIHRRRRYRYAFRPESQGHDLGRVQPRNRSPAHTECRVVYHDADDDCCERDASRTERLHSPAFGVMAWSM